MRSVAWLGIVAAGGLGTTPAAAEPALKAAAALSWVRAPGAETCPTLADVAARVNARLGRSAFVAPTDAKLMFEASIVDDRASQVFRVHIVLSRDAREPLGTRDLEIPGDDCRKATDTAALAIALMLDPNAASAASEAEFPAESSESAPAAVAPPQTSAAPVARAAALPLSQAKRQPEHWRTRLSVGALASVGQLPGLAMGMLGSVRLSPRSGVGGIDVSARYLAKKDRELRPNVGGSFGATSVGLTGYWAPVRRRGAVFSLAAGAEVGTIAANGYNFSLRDEYRSSGLANIELAGDLTVRLADRFALLLRAGLKVPLIREQFEVQVAGQVTPIFKSSAMIGEFALGLAFDP